MMMIRYGWDGMGWAAERCCVWRREGGLEFRMGNRLGVKVIFEFEPMD